MLRKRPRASPCNVQTGSWYQECFCDNSLVTPQGPQRRGSQCLTTEGNKIEPVPVIQLNRCWYFHANEGKFFGYTLISFVAHLITVSALGLQTGCVNLNCWGWSWTLLLPRASADWSQAIPTDSVIHRQGILTPPFIFLSVFHRADLSPPINYSGINLFLSISLPALGGGMLT